jgi:hypothetical protein
MPRTTLRHILALDHVSFCSWGDQGDIAEKSAHPKLQRAPINLGFAIRLTMAELNQQTGMKMKRDDGGQRIGSSQDMNISGQSGRAATSMEAKNWVLELYRGHEAKTGQHGNDDEVLELDLDEEEDETSLKFMAVAMFYSWKGYNPKFLFSNMLNA